MHRFPLLLAIELGLFVMLFCMCLSCSHLNVGVEPSWSASDISLVSIEHDQAPEGVTTADIRALLNRGGWQIAQDPSLAQARVVCRWIRKIDLNSESEEITVVKSFHVQVISVNNPRVLAVADYFYANDSENLIDGVTSALTAITQHHHAPVAPATPKQEAKNKPTNTSHNLAPITVKTAPTIADPEATVPAAQGDISVQQVVATPAIEHNKKQPAAKANETLPIQQIQQLSRPEPINMESSPWIPRFQGFGLEEWGNTAAIDE